MAKISITIGRDGLPVFQAACNGDTDCESKVAPLAEALSGKPTPQSNEAQNQPGSPPDTGSSVEP